MIKIFKIQGHSLFPLYKEGEVVLGMKPIVPFRLKEKDIVFFKHPTIGTMIKQIKSINHTKVFVQGTSADSIDSRDFGEIEVEEITHKVICKLPSFLF